MTEGEANLRAMLDRVNDDDVREGVAAYARYHHIMRTIATRYNVPLDPTPTELTEDDWDPNILFNQPPKECRIYGDDNAQTWSVVSPRWYQACVMFRWRWKKSRDRGKPTKEYLSRNVQVIHHKGASWRANRTQHNLFLHTFIMELRGLPRPSKRHIVDHRDGDERNCTDENLRWATPGLNGRNKNGSHAGEEHDEPH